MPMTTTEHHQRQHRDKQEGTEVHTTALIPEAFRGLQGEQNVLTSLFGGLPGADGGADSLPCQVNPADLWFAELPVDVERAKELCGSCPIREACLDGALQRREPWGVWGGQLVLQGVVVPRKRPRGRPRKNDVEAA